MSKVKSLNSQEDKKNSNTSKSSSAYKKSITDSRGLRITNPRPEVDMPVPDNNKKKK